jgi:hypothetical protein
MYKKIIFAVIFVFFTINFWAQSVAFQYKLEWNGIQSWTLKDQIKKVLSFQDAQYLYDSFLPYFNKRIEIDKTKTSQVKITNQTYIAATESEIVLIGDLNQLSSEPKVLTQILTEKNASFLDINILPFILKDGKVFKLSTFSLSVIFEDKPQKSQQSVVHSYADNSVLAQGTFVKVRITDSGVYKLTYDDLKSMGLTPANVKVYGYGGAVLDQNFQNDKIDDLPEVAIYMNKGSDGIFNSGDYILFYGQGINKWAYNTSSSMFTHTINSYSSYGYYFVTSGSSEGKQIQNVSVTVPESATIYPVEEFVDYQVHEKEARSLISSGKEFYGEAFDGTSSQSFSFVSTNVKTTTTSVKVRLNVVSSSSSSSYFTLSLDGSSTYNLSVGAIGDSYEHGKESTGIYSFKPTSDNLNFNLKYSLPSSSSVGYLNYIELNARRYLKMTGSVMQFQNVDYYGTNTYSQFFLSNPDTNLQIWNISDQQNIKNIATQTQNEKLVFYGSNKEVINYLAIDPTNSSAFSKPEIVGTVNNQNLHGLSLVDMVIITAPDFLEEAETLAEAHREIDSLTVAVVTTDQVYNEFSSGGPDATAYRWLMKMLYDRAENQNNTIDVPKYLLLFGRGTFDNRKLLTSSGQNLILTYQTENSLIETSSYVTDDYFGLLDDSEGAYVPSGLMDIGIGRFPVTTTDQANDVVNKTISYMKNERKGIWKNQLCFVADDGDATLHMWQADTIASNVARNFLNYQVNKIYLDAYTQVVTASGQSYPAARAQLLNRLQSGLFLLDYTGHAGFNGWTNEQVLSTTDVKNLSNKNLPLWVAATCDFLQFDVQTVSAGEQVLLNSVGGGIGIISAARPVYSSENMTLNKYICYNLFKKVNGQHYRIGDIISIAKNNSGSNINKLSYVYMGDPAVKLNYPTKYKVVTTEINSNSDLVTDTLNALSVVTISGSIVDDDNNIVSGFNGEVNVNVYDKVQKITTLNNEGDGSMTYKDRPNILFSGKANVTDGLFTITFMLPKDIKYNYGSGRIDYYAYDSTNNADEAQGYCEDFIVGGTSTEVEYETDGPELSMYLNNSKFVSGGKVNETPLFVAKINDINGINRVGSGIGHDLLLTVDEDASQSYVLNDYFNADADSYTSGSLEYRLPEMTDGKHKLTFRVWDLLNNSTTDSLNFEVVTGLAPEIFNIYNYPNPVKTDTRIVVDYDRPETVLDTRVEIFDLSGRRMWYFKQSDADDITWDLTTLDGTKVKTGVYLYRVVITTDGNEVFSKMNKMIVLEQ